MIYPASAQRDEWRSIKTGWLLNYMLDAPRLVFFDSDVFRARVLEGLLLEQGKRVLAAKKAFAVSAKDSKLNYRRALERLHRLHDELVGLAVGYAWPRHWCSAFFRPPEPILFAFADHYADCLEGRASGSAVVELVCADVEVAPDIEIPRQYQDTQCEECGEFYFPVLGSHCCAAVATLRKLRLAVRRYMDWARADTEGLKSSYVDEARKTHRIFCQLRRIERSWAPSEGVT